MHFSTILLTSVLLGSPAASANPLSLEGRSKTGIEHVVKRQSAARICGDENPYSASFQSKTFQFASVAHNGIGTTATGSNGIEYPHVFRNDNNEVTLPDCPGVPAPYQEYPILQGGLLFEEGADPGPDRIIYKITGINPASGFPDNFAYCGVITHLGAPRGKFVTCPAV